MRNAAENTQQNQTNEAQQAQQQAANALQDALNELEQGERAQNDVLRRILASVEQTLEALIQQQSTQLEDLDNAIDAGNNPAPLARPMIELNRNTLAAADQLRAGGPTLLPALNLVARAAAAQDDAITHLRQDPPQPDNARAAEATSLDFLTRALERVRETDDQLAQEQQQRLIDALKEAYTAHLARARALTQAARAVGDPDTLTRRQRADLRNLASEADQLTNAMTPTGETASQIDGATVLLHAHRRAVRAATAAAQNLRDPDPPAAARHAQRAASTIQNILDALEEPQAQQDQPFRGNRAGGQDAGAGGMGGQGEEQPTIPPAQQLRLLRAIQQDLAARTRELDTLNNNNQQRQQELPSLAEEQRELARVGLELMQQIMDNQDLSNLFPDRPQPPQPQPQPDQNPDDQTNPDPDNQP